MKTIDALDRCSISDSDYAAFKHVRLLRSASDRKILRLNNIVAVCFLAAIVAASILDRTLILPGSGVGLFEHPAIFAFLATQCIVPYSVIRGLQLFLCMDDWGGQIFKSDFLAHYLGTQQAWLRKSLQRDNNTGRSLYSILVGVGVVAFAWNSISNQDPMRFVGFDFWDSARHVWGYSVTRLYKLYMWCFFFPALTHIGLMSFISIRWLVERAAELDSLRLEPFHPDRCGGAKAFMDTAIGPLVPALFISSALALSAVTIHKKVDFTTIGALLILCATFLILYLLIAMPLRRAILIEKQRHLQSIAALQSSYFLSLVSTRDSALSAEDTETNIASLENLAERIRSLPNWPQLRFVLRSVSLAGSSPVVSWAAGLLAPKLAGLMGL